jgi:hypothetical protein
LNEHAVVVEELPYSSKCLEKLTDISLEGSRRFGLEAPSIGE